MEIKRKYVPLRKHYVSRDASEVYGEVRTDTPSLVDTKGYIPMKTQISRAISAGERLEAYRRGYYDYYPTGDAKADLEAELNLKPSDLNAPYIDPSVDVPLAMDALADKLESAERRQRAESEKNKNITEARDESSTAQPSDSAEQE